MDAAAAIAAYDPENEPAPEGVRYLLVRFDVESLSDRDDRNLWADVEIYIAAPDGSPVAWPEWCGSLPDALGGGSIDAGEVTSGTECYALHETWLRDDLVIAFVPEGTRLRDVDAIIWTSADGEDWTQISDPDLAGAGAQDATNLEVFGDWLYAAGIEEVDDEDGAVWRSSDGVAWDRVDTPAMSGPGDQEIRDMIVADGTLAVAGSTTFPIAWGEDTSDWDESVWRYWVRDIDPRRGAIWATDDGISWRELDLGPAGSTMREVEKLAWFQGRFTAIGEDVDGALAIIATTDFETWESLEVEAREMRSWRWQGSGVAAGRLHVVGTGAMSTVDGTTWTIDGFLNVNDVVPAAQGLLGVGWTGRYNRLGPIGVNERRPMVRVLDGGGAWHTVTDADLVPVGVHGQMWSVTAWRDRYVAVGSVTVGHSDDAAVWIGGAAEGAATAELTAVTMTLPDPIPAPPASPAADILHFDGTSWEVVHLGFDNEGAQLLEDQPDLEVRDLELGPDGSLWVPTLEDGVYRLSGDTWDFFGRAEGLPSMEVRAFAVDPQGVPWAGTAAGPAYFDGARWVGVPLPGRFTVPAVTAIATSSEGGIWVATVSGLARWDGSAGVMVDVTDGLPSSVVIDVMPAASGAVWAITPAGLGFSDGGDWQVFTGPQFRPDFNAYPYASEVSDALFFAPEGPPEERWRSDVLRLEPDGTSQALLGSSFYTATAQSLDGTLYVGTDISGLYVFGPGGEQVGVMDETETSHIGELWASPDGSVWMDCSTGLYHFADPATATRHTDVPGLPYPLMGSERSYSNGAVVAVAFAPDGSLYALVWEQLPEWTEEEQEAALGG
jgi:hypothetical protein